jgi:hypothetical protein
MANWHLKCQTYRSSSSYQLGQVRRFRSILHINVVHWCLVGDTRLVWVNRVKAGEVGLPGHPASNGLHGFLVQTFVARQVTNPEGSHGKSPMTRECCTVQHHATSVPANVTAAGELAPQFASEGNAGRAFRLLPTCCAKSVWCRTTLGESMFVNRQHQDGLFSNSPCGPSISYCQRLWVVLCECISRRIHQENGEVV